MEDLNVVDSINGAGSWLVANQALLLSYAVNIVAALAIIIVGLIIARMISNAVNRLMISRKIDATVADFLSALVRYGIIAFTLIAALGRVGVQTASVIAVLGAAGLAVVLVWLCRGHFLTWPLACYLSCSARSVPENMLTSAA